MEVNDSTSANKDKYQFINFTNEYVVDLTLENILMGTAATQSVPPLNFINVDQSTIEFNGPALTAGTLTLKTINGGSADIIRGIAPANMSPVLQYPPTTTQYGGNVIQWSAGGIGYVDSGGSFASAPSTTVVGPTAGDLFWAEPNHGESLKTVMMAFNGYENTTGTAQVITYPQTFNNTGAATGNCPANGFFYDGAQAHLPFNMTAPFTGECMISGL
jgi:hypothetical protein